MSCVITVSGNDLSPIRHQAITWTNSGLSSIGILWKSFSEICIGILSFSLKKCIWKCHLPKWCPFCPGEDELNPIITQSIVIDIMDNMKLPSMSTTIWTHSIGKLWSLLNIFRHITMLYRSSTVIVSFFPKMHWIAIRTYISWFSYYLYYN